MFPFSVPGLGQVSYRRGVDSRGLLGAPGCGGKEWGGAGRKWAGLKRGGQIQRVRLDLTELGWTGFGNLGLYYGGNHKYGVISPDSLEERIRLNPPGPPRSRTTRATITSGLAGGIVSYFELGG